MWIWQRCNFASNVRSSGRKTARTWSVFCLQEFRMNATWSICIVEFLDEELIRICLKLTFRDRISSRYFIVFPVATATRPKSLSTCPATHQKQRRSSRATNVMLFHAVPLSWRSTTRVCPAVTNHVQEIHRIPSNLAFEPQPSIASMYTTGDRGTAVTSLRGATRNNH